MRVILPPFLIWIWVAVVGFYISQAFMLNAFKISIMTDKNVHDAQCLIQKVGYISMPIIALS